MSSKTAFLSASLVALAAAFPAQAQDAPEGPVVYESREVVQDLADPAATAGAPIYDEVYEETYEYETYVDPAPDHHAMRAIPPRPAPHGAPYPMMVAAPVLVSGPVLAGQAYGNGLGYSAEQRADWLSDCRAVYLGEYAGDYEDDDDRGGLLGGLLGAGVGGIAGAAIGSAIEDGEQDERAYAVRQADDYCAAYLARYEQGGMGGFAYGAYPAMMVPVQTTRRYAPREIVREEWVEGDAAPSPARRSIAPRPAPQGDKRTPIR